MSFTENKTYPQLHENIEILPPLKNIGSRLIIGITSILILFSFRIFTPLAMDQFAWTRSEATLWVGIIFFVAGCIAVFTFAITDTLEKRLVYLLHK